MDVFDVSRLSLRASCWLETPDRYKCLNNVFIPPQWVRRWAVPSGSASPRRCPRPGRSPASWRTSRGPWSVSAWGCSFYAATKRACRSSAPGGSSSSPSSPSSSSPSFGTSLRTICWGCRYRLLPDEGPPLPPPSPLPLSHTHWLHSPKKKTIINFPIAKLDPNEMIWNHSNLKSTKNPFLQVLCKSKKHVSFIKEVLQ